MSLTAVVLAYAGGPQAKMLPTKVAPKPEKIVDGGKLIMHESSSGELSCDFSALGFCNERTVWSEDFEDGLDNWSVAPTANVTWSLKENKSKPFSEIWEGDTQSLYTNTPYQLYKREISWVTSPEVTVPAHAMLRCWLYFSLNFNDCCSLEIRVSEDDFETSKTLYTTLDETGEKPSQWRHVGVSLSEFAGKKVKIRFVYTYGTDDIEGGWFIGGYMGDYYIDGIEITVPGSVSQIDVTTGEEIELLDISAGEPVEWHWTMPGAVPPSSTEKNPKVYYTRDGQYDVTLEVKDASGNVASTTKTGLVNVTGTEPVAHILPPATFRYADTRKYMVAPMAKVTFKDASEGFPTEWNWSLTGVSENSVDVLQASTETVDVNYWFQHEWGADLTVANPHGSSSDHADLSVEYSGNINNLLPDDSLTTFDLEGRGTFPGSNSMNITAYAEKFSAPSVPSIIGGVTVFFTKNTTVEVVDQIANIGVHLYTSENGKPGRRIDSCWWSTFELDISQVPGQVAGTWFPFTDNPVVKDEFFIVVDGIPDTRYDADVAFAMADFRGSNGTAWMLKDDEWIEVSSYFPAGRNHTSYAMYPSILHSVISPLPIGAEATVYVPAEGGTTDFDIFSIMGWTTATSDSDWCRVVNEPGEYTVDVLEIETDEKSDDISERVANITVTDGVSEMVVKVVQRGQLPEALSNPVIEFTAPEGEATPVTVTITNPNVGNVENPGTIVYRIGISDWFVGESNPVTFDLAVDGVYTIEAYVRHDSNSKFNSEIVKADYTLSGVASVCEDSEMVSVEGRKIIAPADAETFTVTGMPVDIHYDVTPGVYIVRLSSGKIVKVIVG